MNSDDNGGNDVTRSFSGREAEKYESPIPSREYILDLISKRTAPANREEIAQLLNLSTEDELEHYVVG